MTYSGFRLACACLMACLLAAPLGAEESARSLDMSQMPAPKKGAPEDYATPVIERPVFDKIRWNMTMSELEKEYKDRTFWNPEATDFAKCLKWQEPILNQVHFINVCGDSEGYPVSIHVVSEDVLTREWIQMVGDRYGVTIPFETKGFKEGRTIEFPPYPTLFRLTYENFEKDGRRHQRLALAFINQLRNDQLLKSKGIAPQAVSTPKPVPAPLDKVKAGAK